MNKLCGCESQTEGKLCPHDMAKLLSSKLTKDEYNQLADIIDGDGPAGEFWGAVQEENCRLSPELYCEQDQQLKEEISLEPSCGSCGDRINGCPICRIDW